MTTSGKLLGGLLIAQLAIVAGLYWHEHPSRQAGGEAHQLLEFDPAQVDRLAVSDGEASVTLDNAGGSWTLAGPEPLPASSAQVAAALDKLAGLRPDWPVATTASSQQRFEVAPEKYQRRIDIYRGETATDTLYLGTSPGLRKAHLRRSDDTAIYALALNSYDLPVKRGDWLDRALLASPGAERIEGPDYRLRRDGEAWRFDDETGQQIDAEGAAALASALGNLRVSGIATASMPAEGVVELRVNTGTGDLRYAFAQVDERYLVSRDDIDTVFTLSGGDYQRIAAVRAAQLQAPPAEPIAMQSEQPSQ